MAARSKDEILDAIRRCAADNGGAPLGRGRFEAETGIRQQDWSGRYWARWGDAVSEAGFEPNVLQTRNKDDAELLRSLALLTRELGHFPTEAERRLHRRTNRDFPSAGVFTARLGNRHALLSALAEYAGSEDDLADVAAICLPLAAAPGAEQTDPASVPGQPLGFVYLIRSGPHHKIGRTNHLGRRSYEVALQLPEEVTLVHAIETDDPVGIEQYWHRRFSDRRANGEWFRLTAADVAAFKRRRTFM